MSEEILEAKRRLYFLLLKNPKLDSRGLTDNEVELLLRLTDEVFGNKDEISLGKKIVEYCKKYEGTDKYNDVMMAIEFGFQLSDDEDFMNF